MAGFWGTRKKERAELAAHDAELGRRADAALVAADERLRTTDDELTFAELELGRDATRDLRDALVAVRTHLREAFQLNQLNHDEIPDTPEEARTRNARIVQLCDWAEDLLDDRLQALAEPVARARRAPEIIAGIRADVVRESARVPRAEATLARVEARYAPAALRKIAGALSTTNTTMIFINRLREKIGVMFGSPETTTGGKALKFYASVRLDIRRIETLKDGTEAVGNRTRVKVVKNKMAPPFKQAEFDILYGVGISREGSLIDYGVDQAIVKKSGAWYTYDGEQLGQGKENARNFLLKNPDIAADIETKILQKLGIGQPKSDATAPVADLAERRPA